MGRWLSESSRLFSGMLTIAFLAISAPMSAAQDYVDICYGDEGRQPTSRVIEACTALLLSGGFTRSEEATILTLRGRTHLRDKAYARAKTDLDKALSIDRKRVSAYIYRAMAHEGLNDRASAIADVGVAIQHEPKNVSLYNRRGIYYAQQGDFARAIADFDKMLELDPNNAAARNNRAKALAEQKNAVGGSP